MLWLFKIHFLGFRRFLIHGNSSYVVLYTQCLKYNICSAWFLDIRISTCFNIYLFVACLCLYCGAPLSFCTADKVILRVVPISIFMYAIKTLPLIAILRYYLLHNKKFWRQDSLANLLFSSIW